MNRRRVAQDELPRRPVSECVNYTSCTWLHLPSRNYTSSFFDLNRNLAARLAPFVLLGFQPCQPSRP